MKYSIFKILVLVSWLLSVLWLARSEISPLLLSRSIRGYKGLFKSDILISDSWMKILIDGKPAGYSNTNIETDETNPSEMYNIRNQMRMKLAIMGAEHELQADSCVKLDMTHSIRSFSFKMRTPGYSIDILGNRLEGNNFDIMTRTPGDSRRTRIAIPENAVIYNPMVEMALAGLKPGDETSLLTFDPLSLSPLKVTIKAVEKQTIAISTNQVETTLLEMSVHGAQVRSWITPGGEVARQDTPFGWRFEKCSAEEALAALYQAGGNLPDILQQASVPCPAMPDHPEKLLSITYSVKGHAIVDGVSPRQRVIEQTDTLTSLLVSARPMPESPGDQIPSDYTNATLSAQSDHPDIIARAMDITGSAGTDKDRALAIFNWVHRKIIQENALTIPSALDVLRAMKGDCNEISTLYVALARASGIPARVITGLAWHENAFYYHAWPAVWLDGNWIECDPTWGWQSVGPGHIAIATGELDQQYKLAGVIGQIAIDVLEITHAGNGSGSDDKTE